MRRRRRGVTALIVIAAALAGVYRYWPQALPTGTVTAYAGTPVATADIAVEHLRNPGFQVGYSGRRAVPLWVSYEARTVDRHRFHDRPPFAADARVRRTVEPGVYRGSGYDRGHMAPNYLIANRHGAAAQRASFLLSNVTPQRPRLNQLLWQRLEEIEVDHMARRHDRLWVTVGPIYAGRSTRLRGNDGPAVPTAFYRIWLDELQGEPRVLALRVPQSVRGDERLDRFVVAVDRIEAETGLDFFPELPHAMQRRLEARPGDVEAWGLRELACFPARYRDDWQGRDGIELDFERCG